MDPEVIEEKLDLDRTLPLRERGTLKRDGRQGRLERHLPDPHL